MNRVSMLRHFGVKPYMVFDGDYLPSKAATEESRAKARDEKRKLAMELLKAGKHSQAMQEFQKCIDITPEMAAAVIQQLKELDIPYVVAPYEADAQLVYLERKGLIDGIISDDSDLLVFGAKRLLTKLDRYGNCIEINRRDFCRCREISLTGWTDADFRRMAILSGCDYLEGLPGVGLKTAYRMLRKSKSPEKVVKSLQFQGKRVSENYLTRFFQAELTFLHQWAFCPEKKELVHLTELDGTRTAEEMPYIGAYVDPELARAIARGDVNPITKGPMAIAITPTKRRHSQAATPASSTRQAPAKPISSYFKAHNRIPMGAMDPNCFSVDPQRVAQLTDGGLVPRIFPLPRPYLEEATNPARPSSSGRAQPNGKKTSPRLNRHRTEPISNMLSQMGDGPPTSRRLSKSNTSSSPAPTGKTDGSRPPKKARLCDDSNGQDESPRQSKFFSAKKPAHSPSKSRSDAYLFSDDSIAEALMELPDIDGFKSPSRRSKSISVFQETTSAQGRDTREHAAEEVCDEASQEINSTQEASQGTSQETAVWSFTESSFSQPWTKADEPSRAPQQTSMPPPMSTKRSSLSTKTPARSTLSHFSYNSPSSATPLSTATSARSSVFSDASTVSTAPSTATSNHRTPLQRIGARALNAYSSPKPRQPTTKPKAGGFLSKIPVNPAMVSLPKVTLEEVETLNRPTGGSEDQILPDSDDEAEEDLENAPPTKLDLSRFACSRF
ncbi:Exodeoxyribonuclease-like protein [Hapsidospora chrysogenum ATCC 11550]|uniref:Exodeoxyribonuclease-like protein n=1 Tax=Hapsidospora chrysogenum (strain ATCC 11550 / CBS 779.69 / DSM 880 / IAM 14645 / JCM 23072 / IMI 49137) TaxID=857340 RepID=A0A086SXM9_HAPC1|nr:Exodeoxyribonuclease-like protein [Hapsidospora chrysogenum ATCC 11550]